MSLLPRRVFGLALVAALVGFASTAGLLTPERKAALDQISPRGLEGHVSFLASDALEGRATPSHGLEVAAEYIASRFRAIGLEPAGTDGYFQVAEFVLLEQNSEDAWLIVETGETTISAGGPRIRLTRVSRGDIFSLKVVKLDPNGSETAAVAGNVVVFSGTLTPAQRQRAYAGLAKLKAAAAIEVKDQPLTRDATVRSLQDPGARRPPRFPVVEVYHPELAKLIESSPAGELPLTLTLRLPEVRETRVNLKNVAGLLRGSDAALKDTYVLLTAHYDHVGLHPSGDGDVIYNGANDDASGVASVIEIARALSGTSSRPKRSVLFMTYFGEELGLLGSRFYARNPLVPLKHTVLNLNLEHMGRPDADGANRPDTITLTGFDFTDAHKTIQTAAGATGITLHNHETNGAHYFARSDNISLAEKGVPAHTISVGFIFPDYHRVSDHWDKIDYANMARVSRAVAFSIMLFADDPEAPAWKESNPGTERYVKARKRVDQY